MKKALILLALLSSLVLVGCGTVAHAPINGFIYSDISAPVSNEPVNGTVSNKVGKATCTGYLHIIATGDCTLKAAAANGSITKVNFVDMHGTTILGIINTYTTTVYGN